LKKYLIDTNTCIYYIKGKLDLYNKFEKAGTENCYISEITLAELKFGVENSENREKNQKELGELPDRRNHPSHFSRTRLVRKRESAT